jgi:hypothetical protein
MYVLTRFDAKVGRLRRFAIQALATADSFTMRAVVDRQLHRYTGRNVVICGRALQAQYTDQTRGGVHFRRMAQCPGVEARCNCLGGVVCIKFHDEDVFEALHRRGLDGVRLEEKLPRPVDEIGPQLARHVPHDLVGFCVASDCDVQEMCRSCSYRVSDIQSLSTSGVCLTTWNEPAA